MVAFSLVIGDYFLKAFCCLYRTSSVIVSVSQRESAVYGSSRTPIHTTYNRLLTSSFVGTGVRGNPYLGQTLLLRDSVSRTTSMFSFQKTSLCSFLILSGSPYGWAAHMRYLYHISLTTPPQKEMEQCAKLFY